MLEPEVERTSSCASGGIQRARGTANTGRTTEATRTKDRVWRRKWALGVKFPQLRVEA